MLHGLALLALVLALLGGTVARAAEPLDDRALAEVAGSGIGFSLSLSLNAALLDGMSPRPDLVAGFRDGGQTSYLVLHGLGGRMDLHGLTLDLQTRADGGDERGAPRGFIGWRRRGARRRDVDRFVHGFVLPRPLAKPKRPAHIAFVEAP